MELPKYKVVVMSPNSQTFARVGKKTLNIELNERYVSHLTDPEKNALLYWCEARRSMLDSPEDQTDKVAYEICKKKGLLSPLLSVFVKQVSVTPTKALRARVDKMAALINKTS